MKQWRLVHSSRFYHDHNVRDCLGMLDDSVQQQSRFSSENRSLRALVRLIFLLHLSELAHIAEFGRILHSLSSVPMRSRRRNRTYIIHTLPQESALPDLVRDACDTGYIRQDPDKEQDYTDDV